MNAKFSEFLTKMKEDFNNLFTPITPAPAAPAVLAAPAPMPSALADGTPILITQAGDTPAVGDTVTAADGSFLPAGDITLADGTTLTIDASGIISAVGAAAPVTTDLAGAPPVPTLEERVKAIEAAIAKAMQPAAMAEVSKEDFEKLKTENAGLVKTIGQMFELIETIGHEPTAEPKTVSEARKTRFEHISKGEAKIIRTAEAIKKNREEAKLNN